MHHHRLRMSSFRPCLVSRHHRQWCPSIVWIIIRIMLQLDQLWPIPMKISMCSHQSLHSFHYPLHHHLHRLVQHFQRSKISHRRWWTMIFNEYHIPGCSCHLRPRQHRPLTVLHSAHHCFDRSSILCFRSSSASRSTSGTSGSKHRSTTFDAILARIFTN